MRTKSTITTTAFAIAASMTIGLMAHGQSREIPGAPTDGASVIFGGTVHPVSGDAIKDGFVHFADGVIVEVGKGDGPEGKGIDRLDATGLHVYPGLFAAHTILGLQETGAVDVTNDHSELGQMTPEVRAAVAVNPSSDHVPVTRSNGILTAGVFPGGGVVAGRASVIRMDGWTWEDMSVKDAAGLVVNWPTVTPRARPWSDDGPGDQRDASAKRLKTIDDFFDDAEAYVAARDAEECDIDLRMEAVRPVLSGDMPLLVSASGAGEIESAVTWAHGRGYTIVIIGGSGAGSVLPLLVKHDVPIILSSTHRLPARRDLSYDDPFTLPARLAEAGVRFAISTGGGAAHVRNLNHQAATAAAYGLAPEMALRSVTLSPAEILGVADTLGSLEAGKAATLIVTSGDPLEITSDTLMAFIDGRAVDLGNRQKSLWKKYRTKYVQLGLLE